VRRTATSACAGLLAALGVVLAGPAHAQIGGRGTGTGNNLDVEHYDPPPSPLGMANILESKAQTWREWSIGLYAHYARNQLVLFQDRLQVGEVVGHRISADLVGSIGVASWLEFGLVLPFTFWQTGDPNLPTGTLTSAGLRDPRVQAKLTVVRQEQAFFGIAIVPELSLPIGNDEAFLGSGNLVFTPQLVVDRRFDVLWGLRGAVTVGARFRPVSQIGNIEVDDELFYRLGVGVGLPNFFDAAPELIGELNGASRLDALFASKEQNPMSPTLALKMHFDLKPGHMLVSTTGVTVGATRGYGSPDFQIFTGLAYRRWLSDRDKDGIFDDDDFCPDDPEDKDDFEDADGCPDPDNDKDGIPDVSDRCPLEPEDIDGFEDIDGCPDLDNDKDTIPDAKDKCPLVPEDLDGFADEDGCPEPDNDLDGVPDEKDKCPTEKEVINGVDDEDGCPDEGDTHVEVTSEKITIDTKIFFEFDSAKIKEESFSILNQVALTVLANPQLKKIRIEGHTDERGAAEYNLELSQRRAESVVDYLVGRGVAAERLEGVGYGLSRPVDPAHNEEAWAKNRRVEFTILQQGEDADAGGRTLELPADAIPGE
jgi:outer membrane protein OmpA-like peptidoglycan-associated protein